MTNVNDGVQPFDELQVVSLELLLVIFLVDSYEILVFLKSIAAPEDKYLFLAFVHFYYLRNLLFREVFEA